MPRVKRNCPAGIIFHVLNRSAAGFKLFRGAKDYLAFEQTLAEALARVPIDLLAYCIMPNHWHLVLRPRRDGDLSSFMQWLTLAHVQRWRTAHETVGYGPLYQGRFKSFPIQSDEHLLTVLRYVERNPLRANMVGKAQEWRWSSLHRREEGIADPFVPLTAWPVAMPADWLERVNTAQTPAEEAALERAIRRSQPFGDSAWQQRTAAALGLSSTLHSPGRPRLASRAG